MCTRNTVSRSRTRAKPYERPAVAAMGAFTLAACAATQTSEIRKMAATDAHPACRDIGAVLWMRHAQEYRALAAQVYASAQRALEDALARPEAYGEAVPRSQAAEADRPFAVILDVDETVLDNTAFNARRLAARDPGFDQRAFARWVRERRAPAVPGALAFARAAATRNVTVFYVTNRRAELEEATRDNLATLGLPLAETHDVVLTRNEIDDQGRDKGPRRAAVARSHRVILMVGDDLGDFVSGVEADMKARDALLERHRERWGKHWFILPNPVYGSFRRSLPEDAIEALRSGGSASVSP